jgi:hypothetical protein
MARRLMVVLFSALLIVGVAACGDDGGIDEETTTTAEETTTTADGSGEEEAGKDEEGSLPDGLAPGDLGDGAGFDALADSCFEGDMGACDVLYRITPVDSNSEAYGDTCGGRVDEADGEPTCVTEFEFEVPDPQEPGSLGDDPDDDDLADECFDGEFTACDELSNEAPGDSDYESYGLTCGGRLPTEALDDLRDALGSVLSRGNEWVVCQDSYGSV